MDSGLRWRTERDVTGALNALPIHEFIVVWRYIYDGETFEAIALATGQPRSTTFDTYQRALKRLALSPVLRQEHRASTSAPTESEHRS
jgi:hypothetical protein